MDFIVYKVIFKAHEQFENKNLSLSFRNLEFEQPLPVPNRFILDLKNLSEKNLHILNFQNIEEVLIIGNPPIDYIYNYYTVLLFANKSDEKKTGYLISNMKNIGDTIIGIWPFNSQIKKITAEMILKILNDILKNPNKYSSITLISQ